MTVPAPERGALVREWGNLLREHKEDLGTLVTLEAGKIPSEGAGEVQEMIDICDFAVGLSRQLYGKVIASERPNHRMYEQWHPLGPVGVITAFNFPVAVWSWNAAIAAVCGDPILWKPSERTPLAPSAASMPRRSAVRKAFSVRDVPATATPGLMTAPMLHLGGSGRTSFTASGLSSEGGTAQVWAFDGAGTYGEETAARAAEEAALAATPTHQMKGLLA